MDKHILEGNKAMAEYIGEVCDENGNWKHPDAKSYPKDFKLHEFLFHSEWSQLMPVVEKIEQHVSTPHPNKECKVKWIVTIEDRTCLIRLRSYGESGKYVETIKGVAEEGEPKIKAVWSAIVYWLNNRTHP